MSSSMSLLLFNIINNESVATVNVKSKNEFEFLNFFPSFGRLKKKKKKALSTSTRRFVLHKQAHERVQY